jgi:hypothetical protein
MSERFGPRQIRRSPDGDGPGGRGAHASVGGVRVEKIDGSAAGRILLDVPVPAGQSSLTVALAMVECLVKDHGAVVTETDVRPDGLSSITVQIPERFVEDPHAD